MPLLSRVCIVGVCLVLAACGPTQAQTSTNQPKTIEVGDDQVNLLISALPAEVQSAIRKNPADFLTLVRRSFVETPDLIILVDKQHYLDATYAPKDLVNLDTVKGAFVKNRPGLLLRRPTIDALIPMAVAARQDGVTLDLSSCYRSYETQKAVFAQEIKDYGLKQAERESARAGSSQHQLGTAIDFGSITPEYANTKAGKWLAIHAWEYGFSLSYPEGYEPFTGYLYEAWHYRFVGRPAAELLHKYFGDIQQAGLAFLHDKEKELRALLVPRQ